MFVLLLGRWLGGIIRNDRTPSPPARRLPNSNLSTDNASSLVYLVEEISPSTSQHDSVSIHSSQSGTVDPIAESCYDTPASSPPPLHTTRNFFDNSFELPLPEFLYQEEGNDELDESFFDTLNCPSSTPTPEKLTLCELKFDHPTNDARIDKLCLLTSSDNAYFSSATPLHNNHEVQLNEVIEAYCDNELKSLDQFDCNEAVWPLIQLEHIDKNANQPSSSQMSVDLELENEHGLQNECQSTITNLSNQRCNITFEANQSVHAELLKEDSPEFTGIKVSLPSSSSDDDSDSSSLRSFQSSLSSVEAAL